MKAQFHQNCTNVIYRKAILFFMLFTLFYSLKAERVITGVITDADNGSPLIGVTIVIEGIQTGTISDVNGKYSINVPNPGTALIFSYIGYKTQKVPVKAIDVIDVSLKKEEMNLSEVVVVGYGTQYKKSCVGSSSFILITAPPVYYNPSEESYSKIHENGFRSVVSNPLSTFSIDVDRASYANVRRFIEEGDLPPADAVRIEELINYFNYDYPQPQDEHPFSINTEYTECPWQSGHKLLKIGLQGKKIATENLPASNMVFLIDVSGSMNQLNKLPLVKSAFKLLTNNLRSNDRVAIVVYAGAAGLVLPSISGNKKAIILDAINSLSAGGSTAGCEGIALAYKVAKENFVEGGNNRVIIATDGDFNVGISSENDLEDFIVKKRKDGIFLTCLGFGMGNYKDSKLEILADKGNGNYAYINDMMEANKVFVNEFGGTLFTIAKDVKIQIEFNPEVIQAYRLIGYENRLLNNEEFKDDTKDAGEMGAGHTVTALYEVIQVGMKSKFVPKVDKLKYQKQKETEIEFAEQAEVATVKFRYKKPDDDKSIEIVHPILQNTHSFDESSENTRFAASVAMFGMLLTNSEFKGSTSFDKIFDIVKASRGKDEDGYRGEFVRLLKTASTLEARNESK
jgi:Ca-activated chloride channel family protein